MKINKKVLHFSTKMRIIMITLFALLMVICIPYIITGYPPITIINSKPYFTYTKELCIQGGELSPDDIEKLSRFRYVETLYIWPVQVDNISFLSSMKNLKELTIGGFPSEIEDWSPINSCSKLTSIFAWNVGLSDLEPFKNLTELKRLELQENNICDITGIAKLTSLESLSFWGNELQDISSIKYAVNLKYLKIVSTDLEDISPISSLPNLEGLVLNGCKQVTDISSLAELKNLERIYVVGTAINDFTPLLSMESLNKVVAQNGQIDSATLAKLEAKNITVAGGFGSIN